MRLVFVLIAAYLAGVGVAVVNAAADNADPAEPVAAVHDTAKKRFAVKEVILFDLKRRNTADHALDGQVSTFRAIFITPTVTDAQGNAVKVVTPSVRIRAISKVISYHLEPGEEKVVGSAKLAFDPDQSGDLNDQWHCVVRAGSGKYRVTYPGTKAVEVEIR